VDTWIGLTKWMYVETVRRAPAQTRARRPAMDWRGVLYHGEAGSAVPASARQPERSDSPAAGSRQAA
jgi:hypothetical protein